MESRDTIPDRKLLARLVIVREEARNMMGGGLLDERNDRGLTTLPEAEVCDSNLGIPHKMVRPVLMCIDGNCPFLGINVFRLLIIFDDTYYI
jgi:hypothetical protein